MPRLPRIHYPGAVYHVMARGVDGREIFVDDDDRNRFLRDALRLKGEVPHSILAYCLMGNHFHFAIKVANIPLPRIMHRLLTAHAMAFNVRHNRQGHLFQARYKSVLCLDDSYLIALVRYIHMNPVRAGLVSHPDLWPWSSHRQYAQRKNSSLVDTRLVFSALHDPMEGNELGNAGWLERRDDGFDPWPEVKSTVSLMRAEGAQPASIDEIASALFHDESSLAELRSGSRRRDIVRKKRLLIEACLKNGHSFLAISRWLGSTSSAIHHLLRRDK